MHVRVCGAQKGLTDPWNWGYRWLLPAQCGWWKLNLGPLQRQKCLVHGASLQPAPPFLVLKRNLNILSNGISFPEYI